MTNKNNSKLKLIKIIIKLLPIIINFKRDRKEWVKREGKNIDENKYRKNAQKALKIFIQLGPSYIKLGQWLSSRSDILPQPYLEVFATLQDDVPVEPFEKVKKIIDEELGNLEENFDYFNKDAFSGASLGQVYHAKYNGKDVVVKISRPGIERIVDEDISIIKKLIPLSTRFIDPNLRFSVEGMFSQFTETIYEEMDYIKEAENLLTIKKNLSNEKKIIIPNVILDRTSKHIITTEYEPGIKITDIETLDKKGIDKDPVRTVDVLYQLGTLDYTTNRNIIEKAIELSIRSMHGKHVDKMEVKSLMDLSNKTLSKFPFRLPKYLALYMRMTSIVEGIYHQHQIKFQFVKVLSNLFEQ